MKGNGIRQIRSSGNCVRVTGCSRRALTLMACAGISRSPVQTYQRWRALYRAMRPEDVVRVKESERENGRWNPASYERST